MSTLSSEPEFLNADMFFSCSTPPCYAYDIFGSPSSLSHSFFPRKESNPFMLYGLPADALTLEQAGCSPMPYTNSPLTLTKTGLASLPTSTPPPPHNSLQILAEIDRYDDDLHECAIGAQSRPWPPGYSEVHTIDMYGRQPRPRPNTPPFNFEDSFRSTRSLTPPRPNLSHPQDHISGSILDDDEEGKEEGKEEEEEEEETTEHDSDDQDFEPPVKARDSSTARSTTITGSAPRISSAAPLVFIDVEDRPHKCGYPGCEQAFKRSHDRDRHFGTHNDERAHSCYGCLKGFKRKDALNRHLRSCRFSAQHKKLKAGAEKAMSIAAKQAVQEYLESQSVVLNDGDEDEDDEKEPVVAARAARRTARRKAM